MSSSNPTTSRVRPSRPPALPTVTVEDGPNACRKYLVLTLDPYDVGRVGFSYMQDSVSRVVPISPSQVVRLPVEWHCAKGIGRVRITAVSAEGSEYEFELER